MNAKALSFVSGVVPVLATAFLFGACSSSKSNAVPDGESAGAAGETAAGGADGVAGSGSAGTGLVTGSESCDHLLLRLPHVTTESDVSGLAVAAGEVFVTTTDARNRVVSEVSTGTPIEVGRVPSGSAFILGPSALAADADAVYLDVVKGDTGQGRSLQKLPRVGGAPTELAAFKNSNGFVSPPFVSDSNYAYLEQVAAISSLSRVALADGTSEIVRKDAFYGGGYVGMGADDTRVYVAAHNLDAGSYLMRVIAKTPSEDAALMNQADYQLGDCTTSPSALAVDGGKVYVGCANDGSKLRQIYALTPGVPESTNPAQLVQSGARIHYEPIAVAAGTLYFADDSHVYSVPVTGGTPKVLMASYGIAYITTDDTSVYVAGACGVQKAAL